jgi:hypothetical protein
MVAFYRVKFTVSFSTYSESVMVALGIQHAMRMHHIVVCDLPLCTILFHLISPKARLKKVIERKMCVKQLRTALN